MDVIHLLAKDPDLGDDPDDLKVLSHVVLNHREEIHPILREIRSVVKSYDGDPVMVGEVYLIDASVVASYHGEGDELDLAFNFEPMFRPFTAEAWRQIVDRVVEHFDARDAWPTWVLNNHDASRSATRFRSLDRAVAAAVMLCTLRGTPFLFQGEELGLENVVLKDGEVIDPGFRDGARAPLPWATSPPHGWSSGAWMQFPPDAHMKAVDVQSGDPSSTLSIYRALLDLRRNEPALRRGSFSWIQSPPGALCWERKEGEQTVHIYLNFTNEPLVIHGSGEVLFSTGRDHLEGLDGTLRPNEAMIIRPRVPA